MSKNEELSRAKSNQNWGRWGKEKIRHISSKKKKKSVFNQVKKNESALERIKGYQGEIQIHLGKMEVCQIEKKMQLSAIKFRKKIIEEKEKKRKPS